MGAGLKNANLVRRTGKMSFYGIPTVKGSPNVAHYTRMEGFTDISTSKNAITYERQYVDEDFKRTDNMGYNTSKSYKFDRYKGNAVLEDIVDITENELCGQDAVREIVTVDMTTVQQVGKKGNMIEYCATAHRRQYAIMPNTDGDTTDCLTYSGDFKARGPAEEITVYTSGKEGTELDWGTVSEYSLIQDSAAKLSSVTFTGLSGYLAPAFSPNTFVYTAQIEDTASSVSVTIGKPASVTYSITVNGAAVSGNSIPLDQTENNVHITAVNGAQSVVYTFIITKVTESDSNTPSVYAE